MAILNNSNAISVAGAYDINNSLRFRSSASAYLSRTPASTSGNQIFTSSFWVKRGTLGVSQNVFYAFNNTSNADTLYFPSSNAFGIAFYTSGAYSIDLTTTQVFRDPSAWYHIVVAIDTTQATASNRVKLYVNGNQVTAFSTATYPAQNATFTFNTNVAHVIGASSYVSLSGFVDGYLAEVNWITGQALTPTSFGETDTITGVWKPKAYTGTYGTNGFYLKFSDIATTSGSNAGLGKDFSGNSNYWTTNNISVTAGTTYDAMTDSPTLTSATVGNYCVWNPLLSGTKLSTSNGNLNYASATTGASEHMIGTFMMPAAGKWYFEVTPTSFNTADGSCRIGISRNGSTDDSNLIVYNATGNFETYGVTDSAPNTYTQNDIIGVAVNFDADTVTFYKNNTSEGSKSFGSSDEFVPYVRFFRNSGTMTGVANFGQRPFAYTPPTGFVALNTYNLPDSTIKKGNSYMDATLYTSTGTSQVIVNQGQFKPDFVWTKVRGATSNHTQVDSVRGADKYLVSNSTAAEGTAANYVTSFNSNGFSLGSDNYANGNTLVGWQWQAGQGSTSSNTSGSITSTVSVNTTAGFSVVTYTGNGSSGATVGHGLGVAPKLIFVKSRSSSGNWIIYHASMTSSPQNVYIQFNTSPFGTTALAWNNTAPTSTTFCLGSSSEVNGNGTTFVAYCWAEIAGFSKLGSYTGNGSADGTFVYTGFRPKFVMIKPSNLDENWTIWDTSRNTYNVTNLELFPNTSNAETDGATRGPAVLLDLLSNGFKIRGTNPEINDVVGSYIYMAFAETPFKNALAR